jgi:putative spermidine/putrescine transport system substrate-binding protein
MRLANSRALVACVAVAATMMVTAGCSDSPSGESDSKTLRLTESGGESGDSIDAGYSAPFTKETGIEVVRDAGGNGLGKLQAMVESGNVTADLWEIADTSIETAHSLGLLENLDWDAIDSAGTPENLQSPYGLPWQAFATYMAWAPDSKPVTTWSEFWDTDRQPGKRALPDYASVILPIALLADGVAPEDPYPQDLDRAFASLDKIKDDLVFWTLSSQTQEMLTGKNVAYAATWDTGILDNSDGIGYDFTNALRNISFFVRPKGSDNAAAAYKFLHQVTIAKNQAEALKVAPYTGTNPGLGDLIDPEILKTIPTAPQYDATQVLTDPSYWAEHGPEVEERYQEWKLTL